MKRSMSKVEVKVCGMAVLGCLLLNSPALAVDEYATPESQGVPSAAILKWIDACERELDHMHGFVLRRHGKVIAEGSWKPFDTLNETHMLYSHSKSFTSTAIGFLVDDGKLDLDARVVDLFADKVPTNAPENLRQMRVRDLLSMNTGVTKGHTIADGGDWVANYFKKDFALPPGTKMRYDSDATFMLSALVGRLTGKDLMTFLGERLFRPIGIEKAWSTTSPQGVPCGGWGMNMTTRELARFGQFCLDGGVWNGERLLSREWLALATARQTWSGAIKVSSQTLGSGSDWEQGYGFQFWRCRHGAWRCDGAYGQLTVGFPSEDAVLSVHAGLGDMQHELDLIWKHLLPAFGEKPLAEDAEASSALAKRCRELAFEPIKGVLTGGEALLGRAFEIETETRHGFKSFRLDRAADGWTATLVTPSGPQVFPVGFGAWREGRILVETRTYEPLMAIVGEQTVRSSGAVRPDGSLFVRIYLTGTTGRLDLTLTPADGGRLHGRLWCLDVYEFDGK